MFSRKVDRGFTMVELLMTMVIFTGLFGLSMFTILNYLPKQRLLDAMETLELTLNRAQLEAQSRSQWSCIKYNSIDQTMTIFMDVNADHGVANACGVSPDYPILTSRIRDGISFASCSQAGAAAFDFEAEDIWFDSSGAPRWCDTSTSTCTVETYQLVVVNPDLPSNNRAREVEAISSGMIASVKRGEKGFDQFVFARTPTLTSSGACQ